MVFNYERHVTNMIRDHFRDKMSSRGWLQTFTCGCFSTAPRLNSRHITVERAPEPSDIRWENMQMARTFVHLRRAASWSIFLVFATVSAFLQFYVAGLAEEERSKRLQRTRLVESSTVRYGGVGSCDLRVAHVYTVFSKYIRGIFIFKWFGTPLSVPVIHST